MRNLHRSLQIFLWSYAFIYVVFCSLQITQVDLWWQLSEGSRILHTWTLPTGPVAAFGLPATPYFDEYAGYEVVLALLFKIGGFPGLWMVFAAVYLAILFLPVATSGRKYPAFDFFSTAAMLFAGILMKERLEQRPELVAGLLLVLLMATLRKSRLEKITSRTLAALFFLFLVWTNTHSTFLIGFFTLGLWLACEMLLKFRKFPLRLLLRGALSMSGIALIATMLNPYGPRRLLFPFIEALDPGSTALSVEMWPITDLRSTAAILVLIAVALLAWGLLTTRGVPLWLILFSFFSVFISFKSFRFINFLAISVLFVYATRTEPSGAKITALPLPLVMLKNVALCLLCIFLVFGDAFSFLFTYEEMRGENRLATHTLRFAPDICAIRVNESNARVPVLCAHGIGSYLSFEGTSQFRPLLDSGLSHFSDDTKRYFFFLFYEPDALDLVLQHLQVNYVILNKETFPWIPTVHRLPDWEFVTCDTTGMLWKRSPGAPHPLSASDRDQIEKSVRQLLLNDEIVDAFDYSTLLDQPVDSLDILAQYHGPGWSEAFFNSLCAWVDSLPPIAIQDFFDNERSHPFPLVDAILSARLGPEVFAKFVATNPPGPRPWFWKALEVRECLQKGDLRQARIIFDTISPVPVSSVIYYELWHQVRSGNPKTNESGLSAYGRWQTWDEDARPFIESMSVQLNDRITELDRSPGS
jgi:hypothetical protein